MIFLVLKIFSRQNSTNFSTLKTYFSNIYQLQHEITVINTAMKAL